MSRFERDVQAMLHRRAADIAGPTLADEQQSRAPKSRRTLLTVAAVSATIAGGLGWYLGGRDPSTVQVGEQIETTPFTADQVVDPADESPRTTTAPSTAPPHDETWRALLPPDFDPLLAPQAEAYPGPIPHADAAARYLRAELPDLADRLDIGPVTVTDDELSVVRWTLIDEGGNDEFIPSGTIIVRDQSGVTLVVAAVTDGVDVSGVVRTPDRVAGDVTHGASDLLAADVLVLGGIPPLESPSLSNANDSTRPFGTAGETRGQTLAVDVPLGKFRYTDATVKLRHVGGTFLSITEFGLFSPGIAEPCEAGRMPIFDLGLGTWFDERVEGPLPNSTWHQVPNQERWYVTGDYGTVEVFWPAMPMFLPSPEQPADTQPYSSYLEAEPGRIEVIIGQSNDPCEFVQFSLRGDPAATRWWADALSGQWAQGFPVSLADLDPVDLDDPTAAASVVDVVIEEGRSASDLPSVPTRGSCDGLPDSPPLRSETPGDWAPTEIDALETWLATHPLDGMLPRTGYAQLRDGERTLGFVVDGDDFPVVVVAIEQGDDGWRVERWEAAAC